MFEFPEWFYYSLKIRLEIVSNQMKQDTLIAAERIKLRQAFIAFRSLLNDEVKAQLLLLEESWISIEALELEFIFLQGLKEGAGLQRSLSFNRTKV